MLFAIYRSDVAGTVYPLVATLNTKEIELIIAGLKCLQDVTTDSGQELRASMLLPDLEKLVKS